MNEIVIAEIKEQYPPIVSSEQLRKILHISKRKCVWMLKNGFIPYHDNHQKTRRYSIKLKDVLAFIEDFERDPEKYAMPCGEFSAAKYKKPVIKPERLQPKPPIDFKKRLEKEWAKVPDMLCVNEVAELTGYNKNTVNHWLDKGKLKSVVVQFGRVTSKAWLIEFYCGAGKEIVRKSGEHLRVIEKLNL